MLSPRDRAGVASALALNAIRAQGERDIYLMFDFHGLMREQIEALRVWAQGRCVAAD